MKKYQHIYFDLDRTLWDFDRNSAETLQELFISFNLPEKGIQHFDAFHKRYKAYNDSYWLDYRDGKVAKEYLRWIRFYKAFESFGLQDENLSKQFAESYVQSSPTKTGLVEGVLEVLEALHGRYKLHIITNGFEEVQHIKLASSNILHYFDSIINSESAGHKKPSIHIFKFASDLTGSTPDNSLMIGDDYDADIKGALKAGWDAIWYNPKQVTTKKPSINHVKNMKEVLGYLV